MMIENAVTVCSFCRSCASLLREANENLVEDVKVEMEASDEALNY